MLDCFKIGKLLKDLISNEIMHANYCSHVVSLDGFIFAPFSESDEGILYLQYSINIFSYLHILCIQIIHTTTTRTSFFMCRGIENDYFCNYTTIIVIKSVR